MKLKVICLAACLAVAGLAAPREAAAQGTIKIGVLHSLSGTMAISETTLKDTILMLIEMRYRRVRESASTFGACGSEVTDAASRERFTMHQAYAASAGIGAVMRSPAAVRARPVT